MDMLNIKSRPCYFVSDAHLGSHAFDDNTEREKRLVRFLNSLPDNSVLFLMGDMFDFWFEYRYTIPKGCSRLLGTLGLLSDRGIEIHFFCGNHDEWIRDYFNDELGIFTHTNQAVGSLNGKQVFLAHGHKNGYRPPMVKLMHKVFSSKLTRFLFSCIHPDHAYAIAMRWSTHNRTHKHTQASAVYMGEGQEYLVQFAKNYTQQAIDYFIFGHRHVLLDLMLANKSRVVYLGDWIDKFSYGLLDPSGNFTLELWEAEE